MALWLCYMLLLYQTNTICMFVRLFVLIYRTEDEKIPTRNTLCNVHSLLCDLCDLCDCVCTINLINLQ